MLFARTCLPYCPLVALIALILMIIGALGYLHESLSTPILFYTGLVLFALSLLIWLMGLLCGKTKSLKRSTLGFALALMGILMFGFTYALIPFYDVLCNQLDVNGRVRALPTNKPQVQRHRATTSPSATLDTLITAHGGIPIEISERALHQLMTPGQSVTPTFMLTNVSDRTLKLRVKLSLSPSKAGHYLLGQSSFNQSIITLPPYAKKDIKASFFLKEDAPKSMHHVALGIGLFNATFED